MTDSENSVEIACTADDADESALNPEWTALGDFRQLSFVLTVLRNPSSSIVAADMLPHVELTATADPSACREYFSSSVPDDAAAITVPSQEKPIEDIPELPFDPTRVSASNLSDARKNSPEESKEWNQEDCYPPGEYAFKTGGGRQRVKIANCGIPRTVVDLVLAELGQRAERPRLLEFVNDPHAPNAGELVSKSDCHIKIFVGNGGPARHLVYLHELGHLIDFSAIDNSPWQAEFERAYEQCLANAAQMNTGKIGLTEEQYTKLVDYLLEPGNKYEPNLGVTPLSSTKYYLCYREVMAEALALADRALSAKLSTGQFPAYEDLLREHTLQRSSDRYEYMSGFAPLVELAIGYFEETRTGSNILTRVPRASSIPVQRSDATGIIQRLPDVPPSGNELGGTGIDLLTSQQAAKHQDVQDQESVVVARLRELARPMLKQLGLPEEVLQIKTCSNCFWQVKCEQFRQTKIEQF